VFQQLTQTLSFVCSFITHFACRGNARTDNVYNGCQTNAAVEASCEHVDSL